MKKKTPPLDNYEQKLSFLSAAISDISSHIHLADTKVSIIIGAVVAFLAAGIACCEYIYKVVRRIPFPGAASTVLIVLSILLVLAIIGLFVSGIFTIRGHSSHINYKTKWYLPESNDKYPFEKYRKDVQAMEPHEMINEMAAELYKLNDINRQKQGAYKWVLRFFSAFLFVALCIFLILLITVLKG